MANSTSLLWEISNNKNNKVSYLYGTIHIQDKRVFAFDDIVLKKFNSCEAYAMEVVTDEMTVLDIDNVCRMKRQRLKNLLSDVDYVLFKDYLFNEFKIDIAVFEDIKPLIISSQIMNLFEKESMELNLDNYFLDIARQQQKKIIGIESFNEQFKVLSRITLKDQAKMLIDLIKEPEKIETKYNDIVNAYLKNDFKKINQLINNKKLPPKISKILIAERNQKMAKRIGRNSIKLSVFNAIGAGHLSGKDGVINLLENLGFILKPIPFKFKMEI